MRQGWSQRLTGDHTADAGHSEFQPPGWQWKTKPGKSQQSKSHPLVSPGGHSSTCSRLLTYCPSSSELPALCEVTERKLGFGFKAVSGTSIAFIWCICSLSLSLSLDPVRTGRNHPCIQKGRHPPETLLTREGLPCCRLSCVCVEREECGEGEEHGFRMKSPVPALGLTCCLHLSLGRSLHVTRWPLELQPSEPSPRQEEGE